MTANKSIASIGVLGSAMAAFSVVVVCAFAVGYPRLPTGYHGPRTLFGFSLGVVALSLAGVSALYSIRRASMKHQWGKLETWLRIHTYTALLALAVALYHCDFRFRPGAASAALLLLFLTNISGIVGWAIYLFTPQMLEKYAEQTINSPEEIYSRMDKLESKAALLSKKLEKTVEKDDEEAILHELEEIKIALDAMHEDLRGSVFRENLVGIWMYFHIPVSMSFIVTACVHAFVVLYVL